MNWTALYLLVPLVAGIVAAQQFWPLLAWLASREAVTNWLIDRALRTPYTHITSADGDSLYMGRWWLFNPYPSERNDEPERRSWWRRNLPSVRLHCIMRPDQDRDPNDHPWNARTIVLHGWYEEMRPAWQARPLGTEDYLRAEAVGDVVYSRERGYTGRLLFGEYHRITDVSPGGVWTLFITWRKRGGWGFYVDGKKVPWREYLGLEPKQPPPLVSSEGQE